jgi:hypothetical protein
VNRASGFVRALAIGLAAGSACAWLHTPLPWLIGPLFACAAAGVRRVDLFCPPAARGAGQWAIGTALGLYFTPEVVARLGHYLLPVLAGVGWAVLLGLAFAWSLRRWAKLDPPTAFFGGAVGSASEMAIQGERSGGAVETIAAVHSLRIMLVVSTIPFAYQWLGLRGADIHRAAAATVDYAGLALLVALTVGGAMLLRASRSPNAWVIGPLLVAAGITASGYSLSMLPPWIINTGQVFIGISLGTRFRPGFFSRAPRTLAVAFVTTLIGIAASALFGSVLGAWAGMPAATMVLATAPGGIAEMSLTAKVLGLGVPVVTVFHVTRMVAMVMLAGWIYRRLARALGWPIDLRPAVQPTRPAEDDD